MTLLAAAEKVHVDGTHRTMEPARTLDRLHSVLPAIGVTRVAVVTGLDVIGIPVVMVCRPNGRSLSVSQGKGVDLTAAKVSGIMEAVEAWHAEHVLLPLRLASYRELRGCPGRRRRAASATVLVAPPSGSLRPVGRGHGRVQRRACLGPLRVRAPRLPLPAPRAAAVSWRTAHSAAGNHMLEAVSHALCEVVERDAFALWGDRTPRTGRHDTSTWSPSTIRVAGF